MFMPDRWLSLGQDVHLTSLESDTVAERALLGRGQPFRLVSRLWIMRVGAWHLHEQQFRRGSSESNSEGYLIVPPWCSIQDYSVDSRVSCEILRQQLGGI